MRRLIDLGGTDWQFGQVSQKPFGPVNDVAEVREWLPARVPGDVRLDLLQAGKITDPFFGENNQASQWVDGRDWWYRGSLVPALDADERAFVVFEGIDYQSAVFADNTPVGLHRGMFSRQVYKLPQAPRHRTSIAVRIWGSGALPKTRLTAFQRVVLKPWLSRVLAPNEAFPDRYATLKCQMQFGWDFAPRLRTCGIWDDAYLVIARSAFIEDAWCRSQVNSENPSVAQVRITLTVDSSRDQDVRTTVSVRGKNSAATRQTFEFDAHLPQGRQRQDIAFELQDVSLWEPWDRGKPALYQFDVELHARGSAELLDTSTTTHGIRSMELVAPVGAGRNAEPWNFIINGRREFVRGANWVPLDAIPGRLTREDYNARLTQAREANINFLRVWGGGLREKRAFYDLCDEMGLLVWQEFPFAGAVLDRFPSERAFLELVREEAAGIVRAVRNHPSLVVWCGGNEFNTRGNRAVVDALHAVVAAEDGTRPFKPASPYNDESHNWRVWHRSANLREYRRDQTPFLSEFGLQSVPDVESLKRFLPANRLFPTNALWEYHHAQIRKLRRYARYRGNQLESFIAATQSAQAQGLQVAIEHMRRRKALLQGRQVGRGTAGVAVWQLNDAWPAISWSVIDYYGNPKRAYHVLKRLYAPVLPSFDYPLEPHRPGDIVHGDVWLVNDGLEATGEVEWRAELNGSRIGQGSARLPADASVRVGPLDVPIGEGENRLDLAIYSGMVRIAENEYDLNYWDVGEMSALIALLYPIYDALMR